ncbi:MAG TPA: hypothetical protein VFY36_11670 [Solirubrobacteraceae bacterium]|nr:hypothetical protein [Solirubrobacteraceae bacterium]
MCSLALAWLTARSLLDLDVGLLFLTPALVLALPLLAGRYIGAERLSRIARARSPRTRRAAGAGLTPRAFKLVPPRGGMLIAASLAVRPPPAVSAH